MTEKKVLRGKVADILGDYTLAINMGRKSGIEKGMEFGVIGAKSIRDPDSSKDLGVYNYTKVIVTVSRVEEKYSVAATRPAMGLLSTMTGLSETRPKVTSEPRSESQGLDRNVNVGDIVVERR